MYEDGQGSEQDIKKCIEWFFIIIYIFRYTKAADQKHPQAAYNLGSIYYLGRVLAPDYPTAYKYFSRAAALNDEKGMFQMGLMHLFGQGVV
jgi:hypothetical protein